jgi:hypothetical protein
MDHGSEKAQSTFSGKEQEEKNTTHLFFREKGEKARQTGSWSVSL